MPLEFKESIIVKTRFEALHQWATIPNAHPSQYLKYLHRHIFHIEMHLKVTHSDRDVEFIDFKRIVDGYLKCQFKIDAQSDLFIINNTSCENLAKLLLLQYHNIGCYWVQVLEDGEMGAIVEIDK